MPSRATRVVAFAASSALLAIPLAAVSLPVGVDLPQHLVQVRLLDAWLAGSHGPYELQWYAPYGLLYVLALPIWRVLPPVPAAFAVQAVLALAWAAGVHGLAAARGRGVAVAVLGCLPFYSLAFYWGFAPFLFGSAVFFAFVATIVRDEPRSLALDALVCFLFAWALYLSHALWLLAGLVALVADAAHRREHGRAIVRLAAAAPPLLFLLAWYPTLAERGMGKGAFYFTSPSSRLGVESLTDAVFGGLRGPTETVTFLAIVAWAVFGWLAPRGPRTDRRVLVIAVALFLLYLLLPDFFRNTIALHSRWMAPATVLALVAIPEPSLPGRMPILAAFGVALAFVSATALAHRTFEETERSGLVEALAALPESPRVVGLVFQSESAILEGRPNLQAYAWSGVLHGGELNFTFAVFAPFPIVYRDHPHFPFTQGLEWFPDRVTAADLAHFDFALVGADPATHDSLSATLPLTPVTAGGFFRLYRTGEREPRVVP